MATSSGRPVGRPPYLHSHSEAYEPGDEIIGGWPIDRLLRMNDRFVERLKHAIARGLEKRPKETDDDAQRRREQSIHDGGRICTCGKAFRPIRSNQVYCSKRCRDARLR
jgi:hypothetical protein